jgi:formylglycine-generating enzyme
LTIKAIFIAAFFGFTLGSVEEPPASAAGTAIPASTSAPSSPSTPSASQSSQSPTTAPATSGACGAGMVLVDGEYCPDVEQTCLKWIDPPPYQNLRCGEYAKPTKCRVAKVHKRFCIDREEYTDGKTKNDAGEDLPTVRKSWLDAKAICEARGARLCKESEWELACEGPDISPYPYGWKRDSTICNFDRTDLGGAEEKLTDHRAPLNAFPQCLSPYGVHDMVGNVDEWTEREGMAAPNRGSLRGGWWLPGRNRCRAATTHHDENYGGKQVGFRCCKDS